MGADPDQRVLDEGDQFAGILDVVRDQHNPGDEETDGGRSEKFYGLFAHFQTPQIWRMWLIRFSQPARNTRCVESFATMPRTKASRALQ